MTQELHYPSFRRWVGRQTGAYQFKDNKACPMALWGMEKLKTPCSAGFSTVGPVCEAPEFMIVPYGDMGLIGAIQAAPLTYEALTKRLDARYTKTGLHRRRKPRAPYVPSGPLGSFKRGVSA